MKKQINPTIKAHLIRSAFYVLLLLAVCMIPFALAQSRSRGTTRQSAGKLTAKQSAGQSTRLVPSAAASALAPQAVPNLSGKSASAALSAAKSVPNSFGNKAAQARGIDAASAALVPAYGKRSIQIQKSPLRPSGNLLWYNGDFNGVNGLANEENTSIGSGQFASVYDDFIVPSPGWNVIAVFSDNLQHTNVTGALWEIRQGVSEGNGGTLIASGMTMTPVVTPTGRSGFGFIEYMVEVTGLNVHLPPLPSGLNFSPNGGSAGRTSEPPTLAYHCVRP